MANKKEVSNLPAKPADAVQNALAKIPPIKLTDDPRVRKKFVNLYNQVHGAENGEMMFMAEKFHFCKLLQENPKLQKCTSLSLYGALMDVAVNQISIDPQKKLAYLVPQNVNIGTKQTPKYELRARLDIDGRGELLMRQRAGQVQHVENPTLVYEGDAFLPGADKNGKKVLLKYEKAVPRKSDNIIAVFMNIVRPDGSSEFICFERERIDAWRSASKSPNSAAWTSGIAGMIETKCIKHAFKAFPKAPVKGQFTKLKTEIEETEDVVYDLVDEETGEVTSTAKKEEKKEVIGDNPEEVQEATVVMDPEDDEETF